MKSWRRAMPLFASGLLIFFLTALPVLAAEAEEKPGASTAGLIFRWLNFILVFGGIGYLIAKHGRAFFRASAKAIAASITEAQAAKAEAVRELREVETKIARLDRGSDSTGIRPVNPPRTAPPTLFFNAKRNWTHSCIGSISPATRAFF